ncbi:hypothetical protein EVAR_94364_1 [Eumeta japonica]|uniref:Uncharacterized protein n=1 Tax=Eumeta variegata TaxID=151549 RepID=A0A4C1TPW9_EUMVA|nr:hypothetical protein EVAR_94364_1 [Eumeta japonica]
MNSDVVTVLVADDAAAPPPTAVTSPQPHRASVDGSRSELKKLKKLRERAGGPAGARRRPRDPANCKETERGTLAVFLTRPVARSACTTSLRATRPTRYGVAWASGGARVEFL